MGIGTSLSMSALKTCSVSYLVETNWSVHVVPDKLATWWQEFKRVLSCKWGAHIRAVEQKTTEVTICIAARWTSPAPFALQATVTLPLSLPNWWVWPKVLTIHVLCSCWRSCWQTPLLAAGSDALSYGKREEEWAMVTNAPNRLLANIIKNRCTITPLFPFS